MHWLPLVAMVIASALPFPQSPLPRLVAATTNSSQNFDNRSPESNNSSFLEAGSSTPVKVPVDYDSHDNVSPKDYSMAASKEGEAFQQEAVDNHVQSTLEDLRTLSQKKQKEEIAKGKLNQKSLRPKHNLSKSNTNPGSLEQQASADGNSIMQQDTENYKLLGLQSQGDHNDLDNQVSKDSNPKLSRFGSQGKAESLTTLGTGETELQVIDKASISMHDSMPLTGAYTSEPDAEDSTQGMTKDSQGQEAKGDAGETEGEVGMGLGLGLGTGLGLGLGDGGPQANEDLLFLDSHPRVLFSSSPLPPKHPPLLLLLERGQLLGEGDETDRDGSGDIRDGDESDSTSSYQNVLLSRTDASARRWPRSTRSLSHHRLEQAMCEERNDWVVDKRTAVDIHHQMVTIVPEIPTKTGPLKQYFYETRCREDSLQSVAIHGEQAVGCLGVDKRQWRSSCQTKQSFVRALTQDANNRMGWRWIRINSSCVCVLLSRVNKNHPMIDGIRENVKIEGDKERGIRRRVRAAEGIMDGKET